MSANEEENISNNIDNGSGDGTTDTDSDNGEGNGRNFQERVENLQVEIGASRQRIHELEQLLHRREARIQSLSREKRLVVQNYKAQLRSSERELKAANKKVIYRDKKLKKVASDVASSRLKKELECANSKLLDQNEVIADLTTEVKTLKKKN